MLENKKQIKTQKNKEDKKPPGYHVHVYRDTTIFKRTREALAVLG